MLVEVPAAIIGGADEDADGGAGAVCCEGWAAGC